MEENGRRFDSRKSNRERRPWRHFDVRRTRSEKSDVSFPVARGAGVVVSKPGRFDRRDPGECGTSDGTEIRPADAEISALRVCVSCSGLWGGPSLEGQPSAPVRSVDLPFGPSGSPRRLLDLQAYTVFLGLVAFARERERGLKVALA